MIGLPDFIVFNSIGVEGVRAETAEQAVARSAAPLGYRDVRAVISSRLLICNDATTAFTAIVAEAPAHPTHPLAPPTRPSPDSNAPRAGSDAPQTRMSDRDEIAAWKGDASQ